VPPRVNRNTKHGQGAKVTMINEAIYHTNDIPYLFTTGTNEVKIRIRAKRNDIAQCRLIHADRHESPGRGDVVNLPKVASTQLHDYYEAPLYSRSKRIRYQFLLTDHQGTQMWYGEYGISESREDAGYFHCPSTSAADEGAPPSWVEDAIVYQIFPERFHNGNPSNNPDGVRSWTSEEEPQFNSFYGGDVKGITEKLPYLEGLGINVIYMTPVFESPTNHKYDTSDYYAIDSHFGNLADMKELVNKAHSLNMRVVLDAVFNHAGDHFFAFQDVLKHGEASKYKDWFFIEEYPVVQFPKPNYECFGNNSANMPKLNTRNPELIQYLLDVAKYWIREVGIDGWRLDVANEVDHSFWRRLRTEIKALDQELLLVGEVMHQSSAWLRGDQFDGVMNYLLRDAMIDFFAKHRQTASTFVERIEDIRMQYTDRANSSLFTLIGSHDTERFLTACSQSVWGWGEKQELARMKLAVLFQLTYTGMPMIYYGDEVGMTGSMDPGCRKPMLWQEEQQNRPLLAFYKELITLRKQHSSLRNGQFHLWAVEEAQNVFGYIRRKGTENIGILINNSPNVHQVVLDVPEGLDVHGIEKVFGIDQFSLVDNKVIGELAPYSAVIMVLNS
jgi:cyclomaltodextrinase